MLRPNSLGGGRGGGAWRERAENFRLGKPASFRHPDFSGWINRHVFHYQDSVPKNGLATELGKCPHILRRNTPNPQLIFSGCCQQFLGCARSHQRKLGPIKVFPVRGKTSPDSRRLLLQTLQEAGQGCI